LWREREVFSGGSSRAGHSESGAEFGDSNAVVYVVRIVGPSLFARDLIHIGLSHPWHTAKICPDALLLISLSSARHLILCTSGTAALEPHVHLKAVSGPLQEFWCAATEKQIFSAASCKSRRCSCLPRHIVYNDTFLVCTPFFSREHATKVILEVWTTPNSTLLGLISELQGVCCGLPRGCFLRQNEGSDFFGSPVLVVILPRSDTAPSQSSVNGTTQNHLPVCDSRTACLVLLVHDDCLTKGFQQGKILETWERSTARARRV
jgi:hypothetical protein